MIKKINLILLIPILLVTVFIFQYYLFKNFLHSTIINFYPANYDQASYLMLVYRIFEDIKVLGMGSIFSNTNILPTGILFPPQALLSFAIFGVNRFAALLPNFFYFILMQIIAFFTAKKILKDYVFGFILLGLILTINTPFMSTGGIADFRMDFIAFNLYGIVACLFLLSENFLIKKWVIGIGLTIVLLVLMRFITFIFLFPIAILLLIYFIFTYFYSKTAADKILSKKRLIHLCGLFAFIILCLTPCLLITKHALYQYYFVDHLSEKKFRSITHDSNWAFFKFYPLIIKNQHLGSLTKHIIEYLSILSLFILLFKKQIFKNYLLINNLGILLLLTVCPIIILMFDPIVSGVVCGIVVIPVLLIIVLLFFFIVYPFQRYTPSLLICIASIIMTFGLIHQWQAYITHRTKNKILQASAQITQLYETIGDYATLHQWPAIYLSTDFVTDYLNIGSFLTLYYEEKGKLLTIITKMHSDSFFPITEEEALANLKSSNVVILTVGKYPNHKQAFFPGMQSIAHFRPQLAQYTSQHFTYLGHFSFKGYDHDVYVK